MNKKKGKPSGQTNCFVTFRAMWKHIKVDAKKNGAQAVEK